MDRLHIRLLWLTLCLLSVRPINSQDWVAELRQHVYGVLYTRSDADTSKLVQGYYEDPFLQDEAAEPPVVVLVARGNTDVIAAVNIARQYNLRIAVKGGAHWVVNARNAAGGITVDLSQLRGVIVDPEQLTAIVQGGALGGDVLHEAAVWGLSLPWGDVNSTGMGLALAGGIGLAMRQHGLACDNILEAKIVIANGSLISVSSTENPELLAGLRGAGTVFGIVTELTFRLFNGTSDVYAGYMIFSDNSKFTTYKHLNNFTTEAVREYPGLGVELLSFPITSQAMILVNFFGPESMEQKAAVFDPLRAFRPLEDKLGPNVSSIIAVNDFFTAAIAGLAGAKTYFFSGLMSKDQLMNGGLDALMEAHTLASELTVTGLLTDWLGGATLNTTSFTPFKGAYMHFLAAFSHPDSQVLMSTADQMAKIMANYAILYPYSNLASNPFSGCNLAVKVGGADNLQQLQYLKGLTDPTNMFKNHQFNCLTPGTSV